jgi:UDP-glucose 4-epimerase
MSARFLVTGASGFLGCYVVRSLLARGEDVAVLLRDPAGAWRLKDELASVRVLRGDLENESSFAGAVEAFAPTHLVHLAWEGVAGADRNNPGQYLNVGRTMRLLEIALDFGTRHFVGLGSQAEYGPCAARILEDMPTTPTTMYGAAKLATSILAGRLCALRGARFAWMRLFSSYGPRDNPDWMIPYLTRKLLKGERPALTAAQQRWDYVYIEDAAEAVCAVAAHDDASGIFNLGSGTAPPLREIIERIRREIDPTLPVGFGEVPYRPDQVMHLEAGIDRLVARTGWRPRTGLDEGIRNTVNWYRSHP